MALLDPFVSANPARGTPERAAERVRTAFQRAVRADEHFLALVKALSDNHGAALTTALGADAAEFTAAYNAMKDGLNAVKPGAAQDL